MDIDTTPKSGASAMVPVAIGLVGLVLGAAALFFALSNGSAADASNKRITALESSLSDMSAKVDKASSQAAAAQSQISTVAQGEQSDLQNLVKQVGDRLNDVYTNIKDLQQKVAEGGSGSHSGAAAGSAASGSASGPSGPGGTYTIQSGDYFSSIAKKFGLSVAAIEAANPGVESTKLKVGQKINLPGKSDAAPKPAAAPASSGSAAPAPTTP